MLVYLARKVICWWNGHFIREEVGLVGKCSEFDEALCAGTKAPMANFGAMECTMEWHYNSSWHDIVASKVCQPLFDIWLLMVGFWLWAGKGIGWEMLTAKISIFYIWLYIKIQGWLLDMMSKRRYRLGKQWRQRIWFVLDTTLTGFYKIDFSLHVIVIEQDSALHDPVLYVLGKASNAHWIFSLSWQFFTDRSGCLSCCCAFWDCATPGPGPWWAGTLHPHSPAVGLPFLLKLNFRTCP